MAHHFRAFTYDTTSQLTGANGGTCDGRYLYDNAETADFPGWLAVQ